MDARTRRLELLLDLEARHEDLLERLEALDSQVQDVLSQCQKSRPWPPGSSEGLVSDR